MYPGMSYEPPTWTWPDAYDDEPPDEPPTVLDESGEEDKRRRLIGEILGSLLWSWNNARN